MCKGKALCITDSFRQAFERTDENSSADVAIAMKMLGRVSDATGCVMLVIAHSRKLTDDGTGKDLRGSLRGSGALFDQSDTVYMLSALKGKPAYVENVKERHTGKDVPKFGLRTLDELGPNMGDDPYVTGDADPEWGLSVEYVSPEDMQVEYAQSEQSEDMVIAMNQERLVSIGNRVAHILARSPDGLTVATMKGMLHGTAAGQISAVLPELIKSGLVHAEGKGTTAVYTFVPGASEI
jgi:hypothetical protein